MIIAGTGHRSIAYPVDRIVTSIVDELLSLNPTKVISGMALGWDMALADAAVFLDIPFRAAVPFPGQPDLWPVDQKARYHRLLEQAEDVTYISEFTVGRAYEIRNRWMIDRADLVLAYWDGSLNGGTANAVRYANKKKVPLKNLWDRI